MFQKEQKYVILKRTEMQWSAQQIDNDTISPLQHKHTNISPSQPS